MPTFFNEIVLLQYFYTIGTNITVTYSELSKLWIVYLNFEIIKFEPNYSH